MFKKQCHIVTLGVLAALLSTSAFAGTGGAEFTGIYTMVAGWTSGILGKLLAVIALLAGIGVLALMSRFTGIWSALGVAVFASAGVGVINGIVTAVVM